MAAACNPTPSSAGSRVPSVGDTVFFDDFAGPDLDQTKWNRFVTGTVFNSEHQAYVNDKEAIYIAHDAEASGASGGVLVIHARHRPGFVTADKQRFDFTSGRINTQGKVEFTYGTAAARIRLPAGAGLWPAFWLLGGGQWPATGEIDIMENVGDPSWVNWALHGPGYSGNTPLVGRVTLPSDSNVTRWHVYSVEWTKDSIVFKVDGTTARRVARPDVERYGAWAFDNPKYLILNFALGGTYPASVNNITSPYPGLADSTVRRISNGGVKMVVDWVRVTRK